MPNALPPAVVPLAGDLVPTKGRVIYVNMLATGGDGTSGNPWTGWDARVTAAVDGERFELPGGYYSFSTTINPKVNNFVFLGKGSGVHIKYTGGGTAFKLDAYVDQGGTPSNVPYYEGIEIGNFSFDGNGTAIIGLFLNCISESSFHDIRWSNFETSGSSSALILCEFMLQSTIFNMHAASQGGQFGFPAYGFAFASSDLVYHDPPTLINSPPGAFGITIYNCWLTCRKINLWVCDGTNTSVFACTFAGAVVAAGNYDVRIESRVHCSRFQFDAEANQGCYCDGRQIELLNCELGPSAPFTLGTLSVSCLIRFGQASNVVNNGVFNEVDRVHGVTLALITGTGVGAIGTKHSDRYDANYPDQITSAQFVQIKLTNPNGAATMDVVAEQSVGAGNPGVVRMSGNRTSHVHAWQWGVNNGNFNGMRLYHEQTGNFPIDISEGDDVIIGVATKKMGFFGGASVVKQTLAAAATDAGTTQTLANSLRTALINLNLGA